MQDKKTQQATLELELIDNQYQVVDRRKMLALLIKKGVPRELATRLDDIWEETKTIGKKIFQIGRIVVCKIAEFILRYPHTAVGLLVGAALGFLASNVPFLGVILGPAIGTFTMIYGAIQGAEMDTGEKGMKALIIIAEDFFATIVDIFKTVWEEAL